jgi:hypothetical protein
VAVVLPPEPAFKASPFTRLSSSRGSRGWAAACSSQAGDRRRVQAAAKFGHRRRRPTTACRAARTAHGVRSGGVNAALPAAAAHQLSGPLLPPRRVITSPPVFTSTRTKGATSTSTEAARAGGNTMWRLRQVLCQCLVAARRRLQLTHQLPERVAAGACGKEAGTTPRAVRAALQLGRMCHCSSTKHQHVRQRHGMQASTLLQAGSPPMQSSRARANTLVIILPLHCRRPVCTETAMESETRCGVHDCRPAQWLNASHHAWPASLHHTCLLPSALRLVLGCLGRPPNPLQAQRRNHCEWQPC